MQRRAVPNSIGSRPVVLVPLDSALVFIGGVDAVGEGSYIAFAAKFSHES